MKSTTRTLCLSAFVLLFLHLTAATVAMGQQTPTCEEPPTNLESNEYYTVIDPGEVAIEPGVEFEFVESSTGENMVRYGIQALDEYTFTVAGALYCRCFTEGGCNGDCQVKGSGSGNATCRGGCYRDDGSACVSCRFFDTPSTP